MFTNAQSSVRFRFFKFLRQWDFLPIMRRFQHDFQMNPHFMGNRQFDISCKPANTPMHIPIYDTIMEDAHSECGRADQFKQHYTISGNKGRRRKLETRKRNNPAIEAIERGMPSSKVAGVAQFLQYTAYHLQNMGPLLDFYGRPRMLYEGLESHAGNQRATDIFCRRLAGGPPGDVKPIIGGAMRASAPPPEAMLQGGLAR
ncbi:hypothetical protein WJX72_000932 [[Myrmecia] bisecta]|uniref:Uncharacterized protein n=1 Tax=[Myrmecia] bisecta TaxID=41462 RepID=A0AAW1Q6L8_9CHLO